MSSSEDRWRKVFWTIWHSAKCPAIGVPRSTLSSRAKLGGRQVEGALRALEARDLVETDSDYVWLTYAAIATVELLGMKA